MKLNEIGLLIFIGICIVWIVLRLLRWVVEEIKGGPEKKCRDCSKEVICKTYNSILSSKGATDNINFRTQIAPSRCRYFRKGWKFWRPK